MILTRKRLLVDIFLTRRLSKSLAFCEFASVNFEPCINPRFIFCIKHERNRELVRLRGSVAEWSACRTRNPAVRVRVPLRPLTGLVSR